MFLFRGRYDPYFHCQSGNRKLQLKRDEDTRWTGKYGIWSNQQFIYVGVKWPVDLYLSQKWWNRWNVARRCRSCRNSAWLAGYRSERQVSILDYISEGKLPWIKLAAMYLEKSSVEWLSLTGEYTLFRLILPINLPSFPISPATILI